MRKSRRRRSLDVSALLEVQLGGQMEINNDCGGTIWGYVTDGSSGIGKDDSTNHVQVASQPDAIYRILHLDAVGLNIEYRLKARCIRSRYMVWWNGEFSSVLGGRGESASGVKIQCSRDALVGTIWTTGSNVSMQAGSLWVRVQSDCKLLFVYV